MLAAALRRRNCSIRSVCHRIVRPLTSEASPAAEPSLSASESPAPERKVLHFHAEECEIGGKTVVFEAGKIARFANGSAVVRLGGTAVLTTVACSKSSDPHHDFLPLTVDYREKQYARGAIPATYTRREGAPKEREFLCGRIIDRPIRPLFPAGFYHEVQILANVHSSDGNLDPDVLAANAASSALLLSDIPWNGPIGVIRMGRVDGNFIFYPSMNELKQGDLNLIYACTHDKTLMIDVQSRGITEADLKMGLKLAHSEAVKCIPPQIKLAEKLGKIKKEYKISMFSETSFEKIRSLSEDSIEEVFSDGKYGKFERGEALEKITQTVKAKIQEEADDEDCIKNISKAVDSVRKQVIRRRILEKGLRVDGRHQGEVRPLYCKSNIYPELHGSAQFDRGETQVICAVTVGTPGDVQRLDSIVGPPKKHFMLHYSFPPFAINEVAKHTGLNRREIGHGSLAEKALLAVLPPEDEFPYTIRVNAEVMASDGSTSMASVCGGSMALMDAGVPVQEHVAGISVGLVTKVDELTGDIIDYRILTDILGLEDHSGDIDFKIAGTRRGITAIQLDMKPAGLPLDIICECLEPARDGRNHILDRMEEEISEPHKINQGDSLRLATLKLSLDSYRKFVIHRKTITQVPGANIYGSAGTVTIIAKSQSSMDEAIDKVEQFAGRETEVGKIYKCVVTAINSYAAFVEFNGGQPGLLHISELSNDPVAKISDVLSVGQELSLMVIKRDVRGNVSLSLKAAQATIGPNNAVSGEEVKSWDPEQNIPSSDDNVRICDGDFSDKDDIDEALALSSDSFVVRNTADSDNADSIQAEESTDPATLATEDNVNVGRMECETSRGIDSDKDDLDACPTPTSPSVECNILESLLTKKPTKVTKSTPRPYMLKKVLAINKVVPKRKPRKEKVISKADEAVIGGMDEQGIINFLAKLSSEDFAKTPSNSPRSFSSKLMKLGDNVTAKVHQIRANGIVLELRDGEHGMLKYEDNGRRDFKLGEELKVKCSSFSTKGIPVFTLRT